jgi:predicted aspartyl protease
MNSKTCDFVKFRLDISGDRELYFLLDTGADVSIIKSEKLIGSTEFEPREKVKLKSVEGSIIEHGSVSARIHEGKATIPFVFQLVSKQVDIQGDGILGKDMLQNMKAKICYENRILELKGETFTICKPLQNQYHSGKRESGKGRILTLSGRSETVVRIPVECEENQTEGLIEKR